MSKTDELVERVERLLLRHAELQRTHHLVQAQLGAARQERDSLRSRLNAARSRIDALLDRLPTDGRPASAEPERAAPPPEAGA